MTEEWLQKHYAKENSDSLSVKCNHCGKIFLNRDPMRDLIFHLCDEHNMTELDEHPERDRIQQNFKIKRRQMMAICNHCKGGINKINKINFAIHGVHVLTIHLNLFHPDQCNLNETETFLSVSTHL